MKIELPKYKEGERRIKTRFLLFPKWIDGDIRWLEEATWVDQYYCGGQTNGKAVMDGTWFAQRWLDE